MGYGIQLLITQSSYLLTILEGKQDKSGFADCIKENVRQIEEVNDKLFRISGFTISFIGDCETLFNICKIDDDDDGDFHDWIYVWRGKYYDLEWDEMLLIIKPLIDEYSKTYEGYDEAEQQDTLNDLKILFSAIEITKKFIIS